MQTIQLNEFKENVMKVTRVIIELDQMKVEGNFFETWLITDSDEQPITKNFLKDN